MNFPHADRPRHFPALQDESLVYLDTAAMALLPMAVSTAMADFASRDRSNVHRSMHVLAERATVAYEGARETVANFLGAARPEEIIFTKNATEAINLVAHSWGRANVQAGDAIAVSVLEHHSNLVPWLQLQEACGCELLWLELDDTGQLRDESIAAALAHPRLKLLALTGMSNVLGTMPDLKDLIERAHDRGAVVCIDAAQRIVHDRLDVTALDCDFLAFSGHKLYGPTGIGVLYGKRQHLEAMPPFLGGGSMIQEVKRDHFRPADIPQKFEAGTPPVTAAVGLAAAIEWLAQWDMPAVAAHENTVADAAVQALSALDGVTILPRPHASAIVSFEVDGRHPHDLTDLLGRQGICLRAGHHCCQPLHAHLNLPASTRLSVGIYNTVDDVEKCVDALAQVMQAL